MLITTQINVYWRHPWHPIMGIILYRMENLVSTTLNLSSQVLIRLSKSLHKRQHSAACCIPDGDCLLGCIWRAWQRVWDITSYSRSHAQNEEAKVAACDSSSDPSSPPRIPPSPDGMKDAFGSSDKVKASSKTSRTVNRPNAAVHMEGDAPKDLPEGTSLDNGRRSSRRAARKAQTEAKAHLAPIDSATWATSPPVQLQSLDQETSVPVPNSPPQHRSLTKSRTKKRSEASKDCKEATVTIEAPMKSNKGGGRAREEKANEKKAISGAPVPPSNASAHLPPPIVILPKKKPLSVPSKTSDQVNPLPVQKDRPKYPPELKSFYRKTQFEIKGKSAAEAAAKAKKDLDRMEAVKKLEAWSASFVIPPKINTAATPAQSKPMSPVDVISWETPKPPVSRPAQGHQGPQPAPKPTEASSEADQDNILPSPLGSKKPKEKVSSRKGSSMHMAALKKLFFANEKQASMSTRALSLHKKSSVTAPDASDSRVDSPSPSSPLSSSSSSPLTPRPSSQLNPPYTHKKLNDDMMKRRAKFDPLSPRSPYQRHIEDLAKCRAKRNTCMREHSQATVGLKKAQSTLHWMVQQGEYNLKFWQNYKNTAEKRFQETSKALRKARKSEGKWVRFVSTRRDLRRVVLTNS